MHIPQYNIGSLPQTHKQPIFNAEKLNVIALKLGTVQGIHHPQTYSLSYLKS